MKQKNPRVTKTLSKPMRACILLLGLGCIVIAFVLARDHYRHKKVHAAIDKTMLALQSNGFDSLEKSSGCGRTQVKYGSGPEVCTVTLKSTVDFTPNNNVSNEYILDEVNKKVSSFYMAIESTNLYNREGDIPKIHLPGEGFSFGGRYHKLLSTKTNCGASVDFSWESNVMDFSFHCIDTPWLDRTFRNGQFSL